jgi:hypothetical protein
MLTSPSPLEFTPFMTGLSYQTPQMVDAPMPQKDYDRELNEMIARLSQGMFTGNMG